MSRPCSRSDSLDQSGFTLVEMLVALCVTALISGLLASSLFTLRPMQRIIREREAAAELNAAIDHLDTLVQSGRRLALISSQSDRKIIFEGDGTRIRLVSVAAVGARTASLRDIEISFEDAGNERVLVQTMVSRRVSPPAADTFPILAGVDTLRFEFLEPRGEDEQGGWVSSWTDGKRFPTAIRVTLGATRSGSKVVVSRLILVPDQLVSVAD